MAASNSEKIDDLVDPKALDQLNELNKGLDGTFDQFVKILGKTTDVEKDLAKIATTYKDLIEAISKYEATQRRSNATQQEQDRILRQQKQLRQRISNAYSEESLELERLRQLMQQISRTRRNLVQEQNSQTGSTVQLRAQLNLLIQSYDAMSRSTRNSPIGRQVHTDIQRLTSEITELERSTGRFSRNVGNYLGGATKAFSVFIGNLYTKGFDLIVSSIGDAIDKMREFEKANSFLASVLGENKKNIKDLADSAILLAETSKYTASQVTDLQTELAKLGFNRQEIKDSQKDILNFATALDANLADAATLAGASLRAFGASTTETERYVSAMTISANRTVLSFEYLATAMPIVAPVAKAFNFSIEDTLALLGQLSNSGFDASMAATSLRNIFLNLADSNGALAKSLGKPVTNIEELASGLQSLQDKGIDLATALELTDKRSVAAFQTFLQGAKDLVPLRDSLIDVGDQLQGIADEQMNNLDGSILKLKSSWESLMLSFSNSTGILKSIVDWASETVSALRFVSEYNQGGITNTSEYKQDMQTAYKEFYRLSKANAEAAKDENERILFLNKDRQMYANNVLEAEKKLNELNKSFAPDKKIYTIAEKQAYTQESEILQSRIDTYKQALIAIVDIEREISKKVEEPTTPKGNGVKVPSKAEDAKAESERKKRLEAEAKAIRDSSELTAKDLADDQKRIVENNKQSYEDRLKALDSFIENQKSAIDVSAKNQLDKIRSTFNSQKEFEKGAAEQIKFINQKAKSENKKIDEEGAKIRLNVEKDNIEKQIKQITKNAETKKKELEKSESDELLVLIEQLSNKEIKIKEYEARKLAITKNGATERMKIEVQAAKEAASLANLTDEQQEELNRKLKDAEIEYEKYVNNEKLANYQKYADALLDIQQKLEDKRKELISNSLDFISTLFSAQTEKQLSRLDKESEANSEFYDEEQKKVEQLAEAGAITAEEADARKAYLAEQEKKREDELAEQRKDIQTKQAVFEKALAIARIGIETAMAVAKIKASIAVGVLAANGMSPLTLGQPWAGIIAAQGAVAIATTIATAAIQAAAVAAAPIPQYAEGTKDHKGGLAKVGDGGKHEMVITPDGKIYKTPSTDTLVNLPAHTIVKPDFDKAIENMMFRQTIIPIENDKTIIISENKEQIKYAKNTIAVLNKVVSSNNAIRQNQMYSNSLSSAKVGSKG